MTVLVGCGDDPRASQDGGGLDPDGGAQDGGGDAGRDSGGAPSCDEPPTVTSFALGFTGERDGGIDDFGSFDEGGPWVFAFRYEAAGTKEVRVLLADGSPDFRVTTLDLTNDPAILLGRPRIVGRVGADELAVAWDRTTIDSGGRVVGSEVQTATVSREGAPVAGPTTTYPNASSPFLASHSDGGFWLLRSDLRFNPLTTVTPRFQRLDGDLTPNGTDFGLTFFQIPPEAIELSLRSTPTGVAFAYRVAPSTLFAVPFTEGVGVGAAQRTFAVPSVDDFTVAEDGTMAVAATESLSGFATVTALSLDSLGRERGRATLDAIDGVSTEVHAAVVPAWPGFVFVWRGVQGAGGRLFGAGIDLDGNVVVPKTDLIMAPFLEGDLFAVASGAQVTIGYRSLSLSGESRLGLARVCFPDG